MDFVAHHETRSFLRTTYCFVKRILEIGPQNTMKIVTRTNLVVGVVFIGIFIAGLYWSQLNRAVQQNEHDRLMRDIVNAQASALERRLSRSLAATYILAEEVKRSQGEFPNFEPYAEGVLESIGGISNLQLAPNGIIAKIHPLPGNEKAIGHNILVDDRRRKEALLAVKEKHLTLAGPFPLIQGGIAVIGRNPVFLNKGGKDEFWGFASALIFLDDLMSVTDLVDLENKGYSYQLSRSRPDTGELDIFAYSKSGLAEHHLTQFIKVPNAQWTLRMSQPLSFNPFTGYSNSFLAALLLAFFFRRVLLQPEKLRKTVEEKTAQLITLAFHDPLTGLANRRLLNEQLEQEIQHLLRNKTHAALLYVDLDDFKRINDSMGHEVGDELLQHISDRFRATLRKSDIVARLGGDEFAILLRDSHSAGQVRKTADKLIALVQQPLTLKDRDVTVSATIGITLIPDDGQDVSTLMRNADLAMYAAKKDGKHQSRFFSQEMQEAANQNLLLEQDLHNALKNNELFLQYQPLICLVERKVMGFEALIRWQHPQQGLLSPDQFIPVAEETGLVVPIGYCVIREACLLIKKREQLNLAPVYISVNLAPQQFSDPALCSRIQIILTETGVPAELLELEITETALMDNIENAISTLEQLRHIGLTIAIDDFGTGYSSLSHLKSLPVDTLKIDRSFIDGVADDDNSDKQIVEAIIALANKLQLKIVAEGIETTEQLAFLEKNQCACGQGYLFDKPLPEEQVLAHPIELGTTWPSDKLINEVNLSSA